MCLRMSSAAETSSLSLAGVKGFGGEGGLGFVSCKSLIMSCMSVNLLLNVIDINSPFV